MLRLVRLHLQCFRRVRAFSACLQLWYWFLAARQLKGCGISVLGPHLTGYLLGPMCLSFVLCFLICGICLWKHIRFYTFTPWTNTYCICHHLLFCGSWILIGVLGLCWQHVRHHWPQADLRLRLRHVDHCPCGQIVLCAKPGRK